MRIYSLKTHTYTVRTYIKTNDDELQGQKEVVTSE